MHKTVWEFRKISSLPLSCYGVINEMFHSLQRFFQPLPPQGQELSSKNVFIWLSRLIMMDGLKGAGLEPISPLTMKINQSTAGQNVGGKEHKASLVSAGIPVNNTTQYG